MMSQTSYQKHLGSGFSLIFPKLDFTISGKLFIPLPPLDSARGIMFLCRLFVLPSVCPCMCMSVQDVVFVIYIGCIDAFHQNFVRSASSASGELFVFWGQKVEGQGPSITVASQGPAATPV